MIIWISGPYGVGKSTLAQFMAERMPDTLVFDAEKVGNAVRRRSDVGVENPVPGPAVSVPEHRGIDIAEEEDGDAKHRHRAPNGLLVTDSAH